jgi:hypothetical protein
VNDNLPQSKQHLVVNIDDAIEWTRRLRNVGQKLHRRRKGWWVAYYMYDGKIPVPMSEIYIDPTRTVPLGNLIKYEYNPELIPFKRPELKFEQPEFDIRTPGYWRFGFGMVGKDNNYLNCLYNVPPV